MVDAPGHIMQHLFYLPSLWRNFTYNNILSILNITKRNNIFVFGLFLDNFEKKSVAASATRN